MMKKEWFKNLTPKLTWEQYVGTSVEMFISNYRDDGITDIEKMCHCYANELPLVFDTFFTDTQIKLIGELIAEYIRDYIEKKGGIDKLQLYTTEELDAMFDEDVKIIMEMLRKYFYK